MLHAIYTGAALPYQVIKPTILSYDRDCIGPQETQRHFRRRETL